MGRLAKLEVTHTLTLSGSLVISIFWLLGGRRKEMESAVTGCKLLDMLLVVVTEVVGSEKVGETCVNAPSSSTVCAHHSP